LTFQTPQKISSITEGNEYIYFGTNGGILRYHLYGNYWDYPISKSQGLNSNIINAIYYDLNTNILWSLSEINLNYSMNQGGSWIQVNNDYLSDYKNKIIKIGSDSEFIYCLTNTNILRLNNINGNIVDVLNDMSVLNEIKWGSGLIRFDYEYPSQINEYSFLGGWYLQNNLLIGPKLSDNLSISSFYNDRYGDVWVGTNKGVIFKGSNQLLTMDPIFYGIDIFEILDIKKWNNKLWLIGNSNEQSLQTISLFNYENFNSQSFKSDEEINFSFKSLYKVKKVLDEWYFLSLNGLQVYEPDKDRWTFLNKSQNYFDHSFFNSIANDEENLFIGTYNGVVRLSIKTLNLNNWNVSQKIGNNPIDEMIWDGSNLWICSRLNIWRWIKESNFLVKYGSKNNKNNLNINSLKLESPVQSIAVSNNKVFFAEKNNLLILDKTNFTWKRVKYNRKLINAFIFEIEFVRLNENEEIIWFATNKGAFLINLSENYQLDFEQKNGLSSNIIYSLEILENEIWFGTSSGLCRFKWLNYLK